MEKDREDKKIFLGIDIGKTLNWVSFLSLYSKDEIRKRIKITNNIYGFLKLESILKELLREEKITKEEILIGIESTGHYWINFYEFFTKRDYEVVMVKNRVVKLKREAKYSQKGKNDSIDCHCIGLVLKDWDYFNIQKTDRNFSALKRLTRSKEDYTKIKVQNKNRLRAWIDVNNPIYFMTFTTIDSKTGLAILREYPSPHDVVNKDMEEIKETLKRDGKNKGIDLRITNEYVMLCKELYKDIIVLNNGDRRELECYLDQVASIEKQLEQLDLAIQELAMETIPAYEKIIKIKGMGDTQIVNFIAEIGLIENFPSARALQAYFGLSIRADMSGNMVKQSRITKAGNRVGRKILYNIAMILVNHNKDWRKLYCYYKSYNRKTANSNNEMLVAVACKLLRVLYGMLKHNKDFDPDELLRHFDFRNCNKEKFIKEYIGDKKKLAIPKEELEALFKEKY